VAVGRSLAKAGLGAPTVLGIRFLVAATVLAVAALAAGKRPVPVPGERVAAFLLGAVGYMVESTFFFSGLERGTAAAVSLIFYTFPAMVTLVESALARRAPDRTTVLALLASATGTAVVVIAGSDLNITPTGIAFAFGSAGSFAVYLMVGHRVVHRTDARISGAWVAGGAAVGFLSRGLLTSSLVNPPAGRWPQLVLNGLATAGAFGMMFAALKRIGPGPTAVVMTLEAVFAVILAALFLGESVNSVQALGGVAVLAAAAVISRRREVAQAETEIPAAP
jgi:drug/metabolite transporter (DMT)-like permease